MKPLAWIALVLCAGTIALIVMGQTQPSTATLPAPQTAGGMSLAEALARRRSIRQLGSGPLSDQQLSQLLWAGQGISEASSGLRTSPSAGATYPLELYVADAAGVRHYEPARHRLEGLTPQDVRPQLQQAAMRQRCVGSAGAVIIVAADFDRTAGRYGQRARQFVWMEAGHAAQNMLLQATALGLGAVPVGAFDPARVASAAGIPAQLEVLYLIPVGQIGGSG